MTKLYKLTTQDNFTRPGCSNQTLWGEGVTHYAPGSGDLCSPGWLHAYEDPYIAVLFNPIHADYSNPRLWEAEGDIKEDDGTKVGCSRLTTLREIPLPNITTEFRVTFAILCALRVYADPGFARWAEAWLSGEDRSANAAANAAAANAAANAAAANAAWAAANAAVEAAAENAARAAGYAAGAAAWAADVKKFSLQDIVQETLDTLGFRV